MNILGLIPARGGSKAIPRKNIVPLAGKPLLAYTCEAALASRRLTRVVLNTDDLEIAEVGRRYGVETPFLRPEHLAGDDVPILPVIQHTLDWLNEEVNFHTDVVVLLQPTSPLRNSHHIDGAIDLFLSCEADTAVSVVDVPHNFNPVSVLQLDESGYLISYLPGELILRRQEKPRVFARNGPAILIINRSVIDEGRLYGKRVMPYLMSRGESIDIDGADDLAEAEYWLQHFSDQVMD